MSTSFSVGELTVDRIVEMEQPYAEPSAFFPSIAPGLIDENRSWLEGFGLDQATGLLVLCFQSYVVRTPHHTVLIDSCIGNDKDRPGRPLWHKKTDPTFLRRLAAVGLSVEDVDYVMCTHLHWDHVGWNTRLDNGRWVPTFPKARYVMARREFTHWQEVHRGGEDTPHRRAFEDSVLPVVQTGQSVLVDDDYA